jgi:YD repeat-containing protein
MTESVSVRPSAPQKPVDADHVFPEYVYDAWNRIVKVTDNADANIAEYRYDSLGRWRTPSMLLLDAGRAAG